MNILHVINGLETGGAERMLIKFIENSNTNINHTVLSLAVGGSEAQYLDKLGIKVLTLDVKYPVLSFTSIFKLIRIFKCNKYDVIHGWMYHGNLAAFIGSLFSSRTPVVFNIRQSISILSDEKIFTKIVIKLNAYLSRKVDQVLFNSEISMMQHKRLGFNKSNTCVVYNGFDTFKFKKNNLYRNQIRKEFLIDDSELVFGIVGRNDPKKDFVNFLKAALIVKDKIRTCRFLLVGRDVIKDPILLQFIQNYNLNESIILVDQRHDVDAIWNAVDIGVSSSKDEGFPNVIGEAMSCEVACVVTDVGDSSILVESTGVIVQAKNHLALANGMIKLASLSSEELKKLGKKARERVKENFHISQFTDKYLEIYIKIINLSNEKK